MTGFTAGGPDAPSAAAASRTAVAAARQRQHEDGQAGALTRLR